MCDAYHLSRPEMMPVLSLLRGITTAISMSLAYEASSGKELLWVNLIALLTDLPNYRERAAQCDFLTTQLNLCKCSDGVFVFTVRDYEVNVNLSSPPHRTC